MGRGVGPGLLQRANASRSGGQHSQAETSQREHTAADACSKQSCLLNSAHHHRSGLLSSLMPHGSAFEYSMRLSDC